MRLALALARGELEREVYHDGNVPPSLGTACTLKEKKTRESEADQADVNKIMAKYQRAGVSFEDLPDPGGVFVDVADLPDFQSAMGAVARVQEVFKQLPAAMRAKFENDPAQFADAFHRSEDRSVFVELGWEEAPEVEPAPEVPPAPPPS